MNERRARDFQILPKLIAEVDIVGEEVSCIVRTVNCYDRQCIALMHKCSEVEIIVELI